MMLKINFGTKNLKTVMQNNLGTKDVKYFGVKD